MAGRAKILVAGHLGFETVETPCGVGFGLGGSAYYAAVAAAICAANVSVCGTVGTDFPVSELVRAGIDVSGIAVVPGQSPRFSIRYLPTWEDRHVDFDLGVGASIDLSRVRDPLDIKYAHIATNLPRIQLDIAIQIRALAPDASLSVDCFDQFIVADAAGVASVLNEVDMVFANSRELELLKAMRVGLPECVVAKHGAHGVEVTWPGGHLSTVAPTVILVDPTGAGDVFAGAFLGRLSQGDEYGPASAVACALASAVVQGYSTTSIERHRQELP